MQYYDIGRVLSRTFKLVVEGITSAGVVLLAVQAISAVGQYFLTRSVFTDVEAAQEAGDRMAGLRMFQSGDYWLFLLVGLLLSTFAYAGSMHSYVEIGRGRASSAGDCVKAGLVGMFPALGLLILWYLGFLLGLILLVVPGIILLCMWSVSLPVLIGEGQGVFASFGRSRELTRGLRFKILITLLVIVVLVYGVIFGAMGAIMGTSLVGMSAMIASNPIFAVVQAMMGWFLAMIINANLASIYIEAVEVKEGGGTDQLSDVFG